MPYPRQTSERRGATTSLHKDNEGLITDPKSSQNKRTMLTSRLKLAKHSSIQGNHMLLGGPVQGRTIDKTDDCLASLTTGTVEEEVVKNCISKKWYAHAYLVMLQCHYHQQKSYTFTDLPQGCLLQNTKGYHKQ